MQGCTATVLLLWPDATSDFLAQCANVGDSHCIVRRVTFFQELLLWILDALCRSHHMFTSSNALCCNGCSDVLVGIGSTKSVS